MKTTKTAFLSVMLAFFTMGFVDLVGIASNYVQKDLALTDSQANIMPSLVFFWFLIFSVPTGVLMNRIGRKNTVLLSIGVTALSLIIPIFGSSYPVMLISFSLLGIGNAIMQTSLNPLVTNIVEGDKLASTLTFGQFVKAIASFLAPYIAMWGATAVLPSFGLDWRVLFPIYAIVAIVAALLLGFTKIEESPLEDKATGFIGCFKLLGKPFVLLCFLGIMCHVGIDVGTNTTAPKILMERVGFTLDEAAFATSLYFIFRTIGCFSGSYILRRLSPKVFFGDDTCCNGRPCPHCFCRIPHIGLYFHSPDRIWQFQYLLNYLLPGPPPRAAASERGERTYDYGTVRRHGIPSPYGFCIGLVGYHRCRSRNGGRSNLSHLFHT